MPTWSGILEELLQSRVGDGPPNFDAVRRKYLVALHQHTERAVILYASKFTQPATNVSPDVISIHDEDIQGIMEVIHGLTDPDLDVILHSPGGSPEAAAALVSYLRSKFEHIRVIVPHMAMSAATMIACAADVVVLGKHSFLGPIDPQIILNTPLGPRMAPVQAILEQFEQAKQECQNPKNLGAWLPMLNQYGPDLLSTMREHLADGERHGSGMAESVHVQRGSGSRRQSHEDRGMALWPQAFQESWMAYPPCGPRKPGAHRGASGTRSADAGSLSLRLPRDHSYV